MVVNMKKKYSTAHKTSIVANDLTNFARGTYQPKLLKKYLSHIDFRENHFRNRRTICKIFTNNHFFAVISMQQFNYKPEEYLENVKQYLSKTSTRRIVKDVKNALSQNPNFEDPSQAIRHYFNEWEKEKYSLFRFRVPSKAGIKKIN